MRNGLSPLLRVDSAPMTATNSSVNSIDSRGADFLYVSLHVKSNPTVDKTEYALRLRRAVDARKAGARCACGASIWAIGSAQVGDACFACITGEAWPEDDYEIDEVLGP
jgi:hypothetical protein